MKTLLTIVVYGATDTATGTDGVEFIYPEQGEKQKDFLLRAAKNANGKYTVLCKSASIADMEQLLNIIDKNPNDLICFSGGAAVKTSIFKSSVKDCKDAFSCRVLSVLNCKSILKTTYIPLYIISSDNTFTNDNIDGLLYCAEMFGKCKAKIEKEIYSYASNMICDRLVIFYMYAMLAIRDGNMSLNELTAVDGKLKAEIVLYLALEKRFTAGKLHKLRDKNFKISSLKAMKFKKLLK
ncbi:MAG: hypothetical protein K2L12_05650 [Clostridia bacterium]|nr:hypothetical protein [Clostridia bacterium]